MTEPLGTARTHDELVDILAARKDALGLSNAFIDEYWSYASGMTDKYLGPTRVKTLGRQSLDDLCMVLGVSLVVVIDPDKLAHMEQQWEQRKPGYAHSPRISKRAIAKAKPLILRELSAMGNAARNLKVPGKFRSEIARKAGRASGKARRAMARARRQARHAPDTSPAAAPPDRAPSRRQRHTSAPAAPTHPAPGPSPSMPG